MIDIQLPGTIVANDKLTFGGSYPINPHDTGLNNYDCNSYPAAINDRIFPVAHPSNPTRSTCVSYEVRPGDKQPHYHASGERAELWYEPHDGVVGTRDAVVSSWIVPAGWQSPGGWCIILQNHGGQDSPSPSPWFVVSLMNGKISAEHHHDSYVFGDIIPGREFFCAVDTFLSSGPDGFARVWMSWDTPPDTTKPPSVSWTGENQQGTTMWWKVGLYRNAGETFANRVIQTTLARRPSMAEAVVAAGWPKIGGVVPPPPLNTIQGSIVTNSKIQGAVVWTATNGPCVFTVDGAAEWRENLPPYRYNGDTGFLDTTTLTDGWHTFRVALADGSASSESRAQVMNIPVPPPLSNAELRDQAVVALKATTISYPDWKSRLDQGKYPDPSKTKWQQAFDLLARIK